MGNWLSKLSNMEFCNNESNDTIISTPVLQVSKILSVSILHRHGSRGPGESELGPWKHDSTVRSQWSRDELENLSTTGHKQCEILGVWFNKLTESKELGDDSSKVFFRSSKSGRAKESGQDFISGFNSERKSPVNTKPTPYPNEENPDNYFRPWKVLNTFSETLKFRMANDQLWADKAAENKDLLVNVFTKAGAVGVLSKITKALWSTTYLHCVRECETFWPVNEGESRLILTNLLNEGEWEAVTKLACWVWEERFVRSGFTVSMGGKLVDEILTRALDPQYAVSIYSGHDYTILAVLSLLGLISCIDGPANFSCYVLFELWDGPPPPHISGPSRKPFLPTSGSDKRVLRVVFNSFPFSYHDSCDRLAVQSHNEKVLGEFSIDEVTALVESARSEFHLFEAHADNDHVDDEKDVHVLDEHHK